jgi:selenocysteine lyase/cysteine desulfurase
MNRGDFPIFKNHPKLAYLDSANTTLKPQCAVNAVRDYYENIGANIGRATYDLSEHATAAYESARFKVAEFIGAESDEVIFTHSATYGINQVARGLQHLLKPGDVILLTHYEHNSNILVWQQVAKESGAKVAHIEDSPNFNNVKIFAYSLVSNVTGEVFDYGEAVKQVRASGGFVLVDATQAMSHIPVGVSKLNCDFLVFSAHKVYAPSGVSVLYARKGAQARLQPLVYGSQTFSDISKNGFTLLSSVQRFEPGTPNIEGAIGLGAAITFLQGSNLRKMWGHDQELTKYALKSLQGSTLQRLVVGKPQVGIVSLAHPRIHPHDFAMFLNEEQIAVRAGKACSDILMQKLGLNRGVVRISFGIYTTKEDINRFIAAYQKVVERLS